MTTIGPVIFAKISALAAGVDTSRPTVGLTFDLDWAHDQVLEDTIEQVEKANVPATWYVTHQTPMLSRLRDNPNFELGVHPNFNFLLQGDTQNGRTAAEVVERLMDIVPEATSVRSHSLFQSERLADIFAEKGLRTISNFYVPHANGRATAPWPLWDGIVAIPHSWQDNVSMRLNGTIVDPQLISGAANVVDFHPIHVFLNTESTDRYERSRADHRHPDRLRNVRYEGRGTRTILQDLLDQRSCE